MRKLMEMLRRGVSSDGASCVYLWIDPWRTLEFKSRSEAKRYLKRHWQEVAKSVEAWEY